MHTYINTGVCVYVFKKYMSFTFIECSSFSKHQPASQDPARGPRRCYHPHTEQETDTNTVAQAGCQNPARPSFGSIFCDWILSHQCLNCSLKMALGHLYIICLERRGTVFKGI